MKSFLVDIAEEVLKRHEDLSEVSIILPSRRAIVFLRQAFRERIKKTSWLPQFFSLEDFVQQIGNFRQLDQIDLLFELYAVHREIAGKEAEPLEEFMAWGNMLLQDFNEIDRYLTDGVNLFQFLTEAKAIESWNPEEGQLSEFQHQYLRFFNRLGDYYQLFSQRLIQKKQLYQGLGFRKVAEQLEAGKIDHSEFQQLYFVGFNALTKAEERIMDYFVDQKKAVKWWDADQYFLDDKAQEAGLFLRQHQRKSKADFQWIGKELIQGEKKIKIYGISGNVGQAKLIGNILADQNPEAAAKTAVVLADESLLIPVLESLPKPLKQVNVTMGYPTSLSPFYHWIESYLLLFRISGKTKKDQGIQFYFRDICHFLEHHAFHYFSIEKQKVINEVLSKIKKEQLLFIDHKTLHAINRIFDIKLFDSKEMKAVELVHAIQFLIKTLEQEGKKRMDGLALEFLFHFQTVFNRIQELILQEKEEVEVEALLQLYRQLVSKENVSFVGEPLGGLQIMGMLESRTLDFENIIISSLNEGILPAGKTQNSFIPLDIKRKFGLPSYKEKDAIFAYHFYRLLQRSKNIHLIYNTKADALKGGEKSRFIEQLLYELPRKNPKIKISHQLISPSIPADENQKLSLKKGPLEIDLMKKHFQDGLSPSALNTLINCPLDYYFRYLLKLKEPDSFEEVIEDSTLGNIVHDSLEAIYNPFLNQLIRKEDLQNVKNKIEGEVKRQFEIHLNYLPTHGQQRLGFEVAVKMIHQLVDLDLKSISKGNEIHLVALERTLERKMSINLAGNPSFPLKLKGKIDRIDRFNGNLRIIDYKTGGTTVSDLKFKNIDSLINGNKGKAIQLLVYHYLADEPSGTAGILSLRNISAGYMPLVAEEKSKLLKTVLEEKLGQLVDDQIDFTHQAKSTYCVFCKD